VSVQRVLKPGVSNGILPVISRRDARWLAHYARGWIGPGGLPGLARPDSRPPRVPWSGGPPDLGM